TREGTFFGQIMLTDQNNNLDAFYCNGPGADQNVVPGRLGANQGSVPYANAWPTSAKMDGLCDTNHSTGTCTAHTVNSVTGAYGCTLGTTNCIEDGPSSCTLNGTVYDHPITVWRGATYQAEAAQGGAWVSSSNPNTGCTPGTANCSWVVGGFGFNASNCNTPGANGCAIIVDSNNGMGQRVGYLTGGGKGLKFTGLNVANNGTNNLIIYYTDGDLPATTRYLSFVVNGGSPQVKPFGGLNDWSHPRGAAISLNGFTAGSNNTLYVTADPSDPAPDLDWIEVVDSGSSVPSTGLCQPSLWTVTASVNNGSAGNIVNGNLTDRWTSGTNAAGAYVQIDFTGNVNLSTITLDNTQDGSTNDFPGTYAVYSSADGVTFSATPFTTGPGAAKQTIISFTQESVRAIRIANTAANANGSWWSVGEIETDCNLSF
ncbi:MAG TPA: discoidin domain-containing protein, partial [Polyangia bacterium]|nr:discoidin domain-containing protein [Polyangia bacterium]